MYAFGQIIKYAKSKEGTQVLIDIEGIDPKEFDFYIKKKCVSGCEIRIDDGRLISGNQRRMIYATLRDIASHIGYDTSDKKQLEEVKNIFKEIYCRLTNIEWLSFENCTMDVARDFINTILEFCLEYGVPLKQKGIYRTDDIGKWLYLCLLTESCCVCGKKGQLHHVDTIGMGGDRYTYNDIENRKIELCDDHHKQWHNIGQTRFEKMYKVYGIKFDQEERKLRNIEKWGI